MYIQDTATTPDALVRVVEKVSTKPRERKELRMDDVLAEGWAELKKAKLDSFVVEMKFGAAEFWREKTGLLFTKLDNALLGMEELTKAELKELILRVASCANDYV